MARRSIEMYEYRQALMRMRQGDSEREIGRSKLMGRAKAARLRELAHTEGRLDPATGELRRTWAFVMTLCFSRHQ